MPQPSWSPSTTQQLRKLVAAPYLPPNDWTPRSGAYFVFPLAQGTPGKQCGLAATGVYQPSLRSPWLSARVVKKINPVEIYDSLDRRSETGPLRPSQKRVLSDWFSTRKDERNNIIKLHTGEGKTLIGLLILQSKINSNDGPCLYICPNKYLAEQVRLEAQKFGIPICEISADNGLPEEFIAGNKILITHVQKVFNGRTIFGLGNQSVSVGAVILDDSHACIDSIKNALTIKVDRNHSLYNKAMSIFEDDIREQGEGSFLEIESGDYNTMLPIPYWIWYEKRNEISRALIESRDDIKVKFVWSIIKDSVENCQAFISGQTLEISPTLMPIESFGTFSKATRV